MIASRDEVVVGTTAQRTRVLLVDDDEGIRLLLARILAHGGFSVDQADCVAAARRRLAERTPELVILDVNMPQESGHVLLAELAPAAPDTIVVMVTAGDDVEGAVAAMKAGAYDYLRKPFTVESAEVAVQRALERRELELENRLHRTRLEDLVADRTRELRQAAQRLFDTQAAIIWMACSMAEWRDEQTGAHLDRMAAYCSVLVHNLPEKVRAAHAIDHQWAESLAANAPLHDIGKVAISDSILLKPGPLTPAEYEVMKRHTDFGCEMLEAVRGRLAHETIPLLDQAIEICAAHHEKYDGTGYPAGLEAEAIPLSARIAALADVYDATTSVRPYRSEPLAHEVVCEMICRERGRAFDPAVVDAFVVAEEQIVAVHERLQDRRGALDLDHPRECKLARTEALPGASALSRRPRCASAAG